MPDAFESVKSKSVVKLSEVSEELGLDLLMVKASELIDKSFVIYAAKPWASAKQKGGVVLFCTCADAETGEKFATNLGGQAVVEKLQKYFAAGPQAPVEVTLRHQAGGAFSGYYTLE
jgi:hypothetical protein